MIANRDIKVLQSTHRLANDEDFKKFLGWLEESLAESKDALMRAESESELRQAQGAARTLDEILAFVGSTADVLEKLSAAR